MTMDVLSVDWMVAKLDAGIIACLSGSSKAQNPETAVDTVYNLD